jgi:hypothetical protein
MTDTQKIMALADAYAKAQTAYCLYRTNGKSEFNAAHAALLAAVEAYRAQVIEECATECESINDHYDIKSDQAERVAVQWCAERIRSLAK